jgi:branched-chain amino acid transport system substrate-binding protein
MEFFAKQYYNATQIVLTTLDKVLAEKQNVTGETMHDALFQIRKFQGLIPLEFKTNTASVPMDINVMRDGKDVLLKEMPAQ